jgi:hypothetical protein
VATVMRVISLKELGWTTGSKGAFKTTGVHNLAESNLVSKINLRSRLKNLN